jgi:hypothetical protein
VREAVAAAVVEEEEGEALQSHLPRHQDLEGEEALQNHPPRHQEEEEDLHQNLPARRRRDLGAVVLLVVVDDRLLQFLRPIFHLGVEVQAVMESGVEGRLLSHQDPLLVGPVEVELGRRCMGRGMISQPVSDKHNSEIKHLGYMEVVIRDWAPGLLGAETFRLDIGPLYGAQASEEALHI